MAVDDRHPDAERLAEYVDDVLAPDERAQVQRHLAECADCREIVSVTMEIVTDESDTGVVDPPRPVAGRAARVLPFRPQRWVTIAGGLAAAAIVVLAAYVARPQWFGVRDVARSRQALIAAVANDSTRPVEGRLMGFPYGSVRSPLRGPDNPETSPDLTIAAYEAQKVHADRESPDDRAVVGISYLVTHDLDRAIETLQQATGQSPNRAAFHSDLSAALIERARRRNTTADWRRALDEADRALALQPNMPEALFNRALALESLPDRVRALEAWRACVSQSDGPWRDESQSHLTTLQNEPARD